MKTTSFMKGNFTTAGTFIYIALITCASFVARSVDNRGFVGMNPPEMQRLRNFNSPAYQAAKLFMHGVNLGNYLENPQWQNWGITVTVSADEFAQMKREGFDHVRVPIGWHHYAGPAPDFKLQSAIFARADFVVTNALANHVAVIINIHHFNELHDDPSGTTDEFIAIWRQVAEHYKYFPSVLAFELDNEPRHKATPVVLNQIYASAITEIRKTNPNRTIFVQPEWGSLGQLKNLVLPPDDNVIVSVHEYDPRYFTFQGNAAWAGPDVRQTGFVFPGPPPQPLVPDASLNMTPLELDWIYKYNTLPTDKNPSSKMAFAGHLRFIRAWSDYYGRPVHIGEFGVSTIADDRSRVNYYSAFRHTAEECQLGWCMWDWSAGFRYWDKTNNHPMPGMREALFGQ